MTVRSTCLYIGQPAAGDVTAYTCPVGHRTLLKTWILTNGNANANTTFLRMDRGATQVLLNPLGVALASFGQLVSERWLVMHAGDELHVVSTLIGNQLIVAGAELAL